MNKSKQQKKMSINYRGQTLEKEFVSKHGEWLITSDGYIFNSSIQDHLHKRQLYLEDLKRMGCHQPSVQLLMMNTMFSLIWSSDKRNSWEEWLHLMNEIFPTLAVDNWREKPSAFYVEKYLRENTKPKRKPIKASLRFKILHRDQYRCQTCGASAAGGADLHVDHILPVSKGGTNDESNLRALCSECNIGRGNRYDT